MNLYLKLFIIYLALINVFSIIVTAYDKHAAVRHMRRIREKTLLILSFFGGSAGMYITMLLIRHKTRRIKFMLGIPIIFFLQCAAIFYMARSMIYG